MAKVFLVDDDAALVGVVKDWLIHEKHTVESVGTGREALEFLKTYPYDLIILDWGLPDIDGDEVLKQYRAGGGVAPVLMLTGRKQIDDKEAGFEAGADDYLTKPFEIRELGARLRALLRRPPNWHDTSLKIGDIYLDPASHKVSVKGVEIQLYPKDYALLDFLMRHADKVFTSEQLIDHVWDADAALTDEAIRTSVKRLRKALDREGEPSRIETVYGVGYKFRSAT